MKAVITWAEFEHLQDRVDTIENVLCDLATFAEEKDKITAGDISKALHDAGIFSSPPKGHKKL